ncbi:TadE/TadG family type IV pilus assembly protein [Pasteurella canis]|uniref:TadE/TadG family type IV pilus assembly protein n=1 Tax=Pasteurella canis TaxID=753 RepID=UPI000D9CF9B9|nr:TadE/TadG family type IV pilus assembly protein [Pasteurella canis]SPY33371.1 protein TadG [Pasteurella canis]
MKKYYLIYRYYLRIKRFYKSQKGVYAVMTALLTFPLLVLVAFTVDGTGILLDKARLSQATEQAALMLVAENNQFRKNPHHQDVQNQKVTVEEQKNYKSLLDAQQDKRNQEMIQGMVKVYLRSENKGGSEKDQPVTIPEPFNYHCEQTIAAKTAQQSPTKSVSCVVDGNIRRRFWIPLSEQLVKPQTKGGRLPMYSGISMAVKENGLTTPIDLMLVSDFSKSMLWEVGQQERDQNGKELPQGTYPNRKIDILRDVVRDISQMLLPSKETEGISPYNRMGFTTFAAGARQRDNTEKCVLPYYLEEGKKSLTVKKIILDREDKYRSFQEQYSDVIYGEQCRITRNHYINVNETCNIQVQPKALLKEALRIGDWETINRIFNKFLDVNRTLNDIDTFSGNKKNYEFEFKDERFCLGENQGTVTTQAWFDKNNPNISYALESVNPKGGTAVTSGLLIGANIMMDKNKTAEAQPDKIQTNTQRIILVLSDGTDNQPSKDTLVKLIDAGVCHRIQGKIDSLQDKNYHTLPTRIAFVAFGFNPPADQVAAWKKCVGNHYYQAQNKEQLLNSFKQIISLDEEVGRAARFKKK